MRALLQSFRREGLSPEQWYSMGVVFALVALVILVAFAVLFALFGLALVTFVAISGTMAEDGVFTVSEQTGFGSVHGFRIGWY